MDLPKTGGNVGGDHLLGLGHCLIRRQIPPRTGTEMVTAQDDEALGATFLQRDLANECGKIRRPHAGIATAVVDLVARGLDQNGAVVGPAMPERCTQHGRVSRADRSHAPQLAIAPHRGEAAQLKLHQERLSVRAMNSSSSASVPAPSIGPRRVTLRAPAAQA